MEKKKLSYKELLKLIKKYQSGGRGNKVNLIIEITSK